MNNYNSELQKAHLHLKKVDPTMKSIISACDTCDILPQQEHFKMLLNSIVGQQLSVKAAATIRGRVHDLAKGRIHPKKYLALSHTQLRDAGLSNQKAKYVHELSEAFSDPKLKLKDLHKWNNKEVYNELIKIKGIGEWTIHMFLMFGLARLDILPHGDLGIQNAFRKFYRMRLPVTQQKMERVAKKWQPYRTVASWYLWRGLDQK